MRLYLGYYVEEEKGAKIYRALTILSPPTLIHLILTTTLSYTFLSFYKSETTDRLCKRKKQVIELISEFQTP